MLVDAALCAMSSCQRPRSQAHQVNAGSGDCSCTDSSSRRRVAWLGWLPWRERVVGWSAAHPAQPQQQQPTTAPHLHRQQRGAVAGQQRCGCQRQPSQRLQMRWRGAWGASNASGGEARFWRETMLRVFCCVLRTPRAPPAHCDGAAPVQRSAAVGLTAATASGRHRRGDGWRLDRRFGSHDAWPHRRRGSHAFRKPVVERAAQQQPGRTGREAHQGSPPRSRPPPNTLAAELPAAGKGEEQEKPTTREAGVTGQDLGG